MLLGLGGDDLGGRALRHLRQAACVVLAVGARRRIVAAFLISGEIAVEQDHLAVGAQARAAVVGLQVDHGAFDARLLHLAGDHPLPHQLIEPAEVALQAQGAGVARQAGGANGLVRLLGVLGLGLVVARLFGDVGGPITAGDDFARLVDGLLGHLHAVGPHIGDQADGLPADVDAFVQLLRRLHGALGREAELARGFLLQGRGGEGRSGGALGRLLLDRADLELARFHRGQRFVSQGLVVQVELGQALALMLDQAREEGVRAGGNVGLHAPVFLALESLDLGLALDDQAQGHRLHASGRTRARQLAPQDRREGEAHQVIQRAAGQIGVHQLHVDVARMLHRLRDGRLGDGVEHHTLDLGVLHGLLAVKHLQHVPGDGFAFAVRVGGQDQGLGALERLGDVAQPLGRFGVHVPGHGKVLVGQDRTILGRQVAHVSVARQHRVIGAQVLIDGLGLGRALDDDDVHKEMDTL